MKAKLFVVMFILGLTGCGKEAQKVQDPGPRFGMTAAGMKFDQNHVLMADMKRGDVEFGPVVSADFGDSRPANIAAVEKKLSCGPVMIAGKTRMANDPEAVSFRLSEKEFKGISLLPLRSPCRLLVTAKNNIGSAFTLTQPVLLQFDTPPALETTSAVMAVGLYNSRRDGSLILEKIRIRNNLPYPIKVLYRPTRAIEYMRYFDVSVRNLFASSLIPVRKGCFNEKQIAGVNQIEVHGLTRTEGDMVSSTVTELDPDDTVDLAAVFVPPVSTTAPMGPLKDGSTLMLEGAYVTKSAEQVPAGPVMIPVSFKSNEWTPVKGETRALETAPPPPPTLPSQVCPILPMPL